MAGKIDPGRLAQIVTVLGVVITAGAGLGTVLIQGRQSNEQAQCRLAGDILQDDTPTPYLSTQGKQRLAADALRRIARCFQE